MAYGINLYDAQSRVILSTSYVPFNFIDRFLVPANTTVQKTYTVTAGRKLSAFSANLGHHAFYNSGNFKVTISGGSVTITPVGNANFSAVVTIISRSS